MTDPKIRIATGPREINNPTGLNAYEFKEVSLSSVGLFKDISTTVEKPKEKPTEEKPKPNHLSVVT